MGMVQGAQQVHALQSLLHRIQWSIETSSSIHVLAVQMEHYEHKDKNVGE